MNFAATAVSVVLAVIAIVITLVDAAGQKNNVVQLEKSNNKLKKSLEDVQKLVESIPNALESLREITDEYKATIQDNKNFGDKIIADIQEIAKDIKKETKGEDVTDKLEKIIDNVKESQVTMDSLYLYKFKFHLRAVDSDAIISIFDLKKFIKEKLGFGSVIIRRFKAANDFILNVSSDKKISRSNINEMLMEYHQKIEVLH